MDNAAVVCVDIKPDNIYLLKNFIANIGSASETFRYYNKRSVDVISHHLETLMLMADNLPVAYGHLEYENNILWLGICVLPDHARKGYGNLMMKNLIGRAKEHNVDEIDLTVDKINLQAIRLYEKFDFDKVSEHDSHFRYRLVLK
jgi:RimJ/RimL family protein N-acetyltransferase